MDQVLIAEIPESVRLPFLALSKFGLFSTNKLKVIPVTILVLMLASIVLIAMLQFFYVESDISNIVRNLECVFGFSLLFWDPTICDQQTKLKLILIRRFIYKLQRLLLLAMSIAVVLVAVVCVVQNTTPTGMWTMEGHEKLYQFLMIYCLYLGLCAEIVIQFKILSQCLQNLTAGGKNEIKAYVTHHRLILRFVKEFLQAFSLVLLVEVVIDGPFICAQLLAAFER
ncbi:hypothetical protein ILUMI_07682 [Ignelater luminosus]|uniref:Uncharacterized protein n=1 Tax=Ignelater luminosus TaxID=2038154 RepID=A0A8K0D3E6_IGNLU|nr:hypothetical protein ILUMI_07682 [Ignelater luminosus]